MKILSLLNLLSLLTAPATFAAPGEWQKIGQDDGVTVYKKEVSGSPIVAFKGEGVVDAPLWKIFSVMADESRDKEWVDDLEEMHVVRVITPLERVEYNHVGTPFIVKDRDFVIDVKVVPHQDTHQIDVLMHSIVDPLAPETHYVRGEMLDSTFILKPEAGDQKVLVTCEIQVDPKGNLPSWLVNLVQKGWPHNTILKLRKQVAKSDIKRMPSFDEMFKINSERVSETQSKFSR